MNIRGKTAVDLAKQRGHKHIAELIIHYKSTPIGELTYKKFNSH